MVTKHMSQEKGGLMSHPSQQIQSAPMSSVACSQIHSGATTHGGASITVHLDAGFGNSLYLRGEGGGLSWERGILMRNIDAKTWKWESPQGASLPKAFKVLLNDRQYENGNNHMLNAQGRAEYTPHFS